MNSRQVIVIIAEIIFLILLVLWIGYLDNEIKNVSDHIKILQDYFVALIEDKPVYPTLKKELMKRSAQVSLCRYYTGPDYLHEGGERFNIRVYERYKKDGMIDELKHYFMSRELDLPRNYLSLYKGAKPVVIFIISLSIIVAAVLLYRFRDN